jgi:hypothetical protein
MGSQHLKLASLFAVLIVVTMYLMLIGHRPVYGQTTSQTVGGNVSNSKIAGRDINETNIYNTYNNYMVFVIGKPTLFDSEITSNKQENVQKKIAQSQIVNFNKSSEDAEKWATSFLETLSPRKEENRFKKEEELRRFEAIKINIVAGLGYILASLDERIAALQNRISGISSVKQPGSLTLSVNGKSSELSGYSGRKIAFPNGNLLLVSLQGGISFQRQIIEGNPLLSFTKLIRSEHESLLVIRFPLTGFATLRGDPTPSITYNPKDGFPLSEGFKTELSKALDAVISELL